MSPKPQSRNTELFQAALSAREKAHSPYSHQKVGAAILTESGRIYTGCNVENSSYGGSICAEQVAVTKAVSEEGEMKIREILVVTDATPAWPPCGICRQVLAEFIEPEKGGAVSVHAANLQGEMRTETFRDLFPNAFTPSHLLDHPQG